MGLGISYWVRVRARVRVCVRQGLTKPPTATGRPHNSIYNWVCPKRHAVGLDPFTMRDPPYPPIPNPQYPGYRFEWPGARFKIPEDPEEIRLERERIIEGRARSVGVLRWEVWKAKIEQVALAPHSTAPSFRPAP